MNNEFFKQFLETLANQLDLIDEVYPPMIANTRPFDRILASKIEAAMKADRELLEYLRTKMEKREALPRHIVAGLLER